MKLFIVNFVILLNYLHCPAQEIVLLEEGREIKILSNLKTTPKIGETIVFRIKYDVYAEDNLVIESESKVNGVVMGKEKNGGSLVKISKVYDLHGNEIKVRTAKGGNNYLLVKPTQKEFIIYVDDSFWFSY
jgi:hypothetical protein